jgi:hypothetical protein
MMRTLATLAALAIFGAAPAVAAPWTSPAPVPGSNGVGFPYDAAAWRDGTTAVAFIRDGIRVALRAPGGRWTPAERVSSGDTGVAAPDVAVDAAGEVIVAWTQNTVHAAAPSQGRVYVRVAIRSTVGRWSAPQTVGRTRHLVDGQPRLAANASGDAVLAWRGVRPTGTRDLLQAVYRRPAGVFGAAQSLSEPGTDLQVALDDHGTAFAVWSHPRPPSGVASSIRLATRGRTGAWARPQTIYAGNAGDPQLAVPGDGPLLLAWRGAQVGVGATRTGFAMLAERTDATTSEPRLLSHTRTLGPQLAANAAGEAVVAWTAPSEALDPTAGAPVLYSSTRPRGGAFGPVQIATGLRAGPLAMLSDGTAITVWSGTGLRAAARTPGGAFTTAEMIASRGDFPVLAAGDDLAVAVWLDRGRLTAAARART